MTNIVTLHVPRGRAAYWNDELECNEVRCVRCRQLWPCDTQFFHAVNLQSDNPIPRPQCKGCEAERQRYRRQRIAA